MNIFKRLINNFKVQTFLMILAVILVIISSAAIRSYNASLSTPTEEIVAETVIFEIIPLESFSDEDAINYSLEDLDMIITNLLESQAKYHELANKARDVGWPEDCETIQSAKISWHNAEMKIQFYSPIYLSLYEISEKKIWDERKTEYPVATEIWLYLNSLGYSDYVCAGILGNMMAEAGGQTLNIKPEIYNSTKSYYGICQWSKKYYPNVQGVSLQEQLVFLNSNIKYEIDTYGRIYKSNFKFHDFLNLTCEKEVALVFAKSYERCDSRYYSIRQENATKALKYFTTK